MPEPRHRPRIIDGQLLAAVDGLPASLLEGAIGVGKRRQLSACAPQPGDWMIQANALSSLPTRRSSASTSAPLDASVGDEATDPGGRRDPRWETATRTLEAAGATIEVTRPVVWTWTSGRRPFAVPSHLWHLPMHEAFRVLTPGPHLWWSRPALQLDLANRSDRSHAYEIVLRGGTPGDIRSVVDDALLIYLWPDLVVPAELRRAWQPAVDVVERSLATAS